MIDQEGDHHCSHNGKELEYDHSKRILKCVSHHSEFDLKGNVIKGNAEKSLKGYATDQNAGTIIVKI